MQKNVMTHFQKINHFLSHFLQSGIDFLLAHAIEEEIN